MLLVIQRLLNCLNPARALGLELALVLLQILLGRQHGLVSRALLLQEPHPEVQPGSELREAVNANQNVDERDVAALVDLSGPLLQASLRLLQILLRSLE